MDMLSTYHDQLEAHGFVPFNNETPEFFPVDIEPLYDSKGSEVVNAQRVVRTDTNETLKVHSASYELISYQDSFAQFDQQLNASGLDTTDMVVATDMSHHGARCFRQYVLPAHTIEVAGDTIALRLLMFNSYDGSIKFKGMAGAYRFICTNGCVFGTHVINVGVKHVKGASAKIDLAIDSVVAAADSFMNFRPRLEAMAEITVQDTDGYGLIDGLKNISEPTKDMLFRRWVLEHDDSMYSLYNTMTSWSSHDSVGANAPQSRTDREIKIAELIESDDWRILEDTVR